MIPWHRRKATYSPRMTARSFLLRIVLSSAILAISCSTAAAQSQPDSTEAEVWPEVDAHIQLPSNLRVLAFAGTEQGLGFPFQQWYGAVALGYQFQPILTPHLKNIDPDKEHYFVFGGGYQHLRTTDSGKLTHEDRFTLDLTVNFRLPAQFLIRDRNWTELRWIEGQYLTTYRNMVVAEHDFVLHGSRFSLYGSAEMFYNQHAGPKNSWDQEWYTAGVEWPYKHIFMLDTYYRREHCPTCTPENWNVGGVSLNFFFRNPQ